MKASQKAEGDTIACVVLNWNGGDDTERCVRSLLSSEDVVLDIVVVDNGSSDGSADRLVNLFPHITILRQQSNVGVARGFNLGIEWAVARGHSMLFFLNNDATVDKDCLLTMKKYLDADQGLGIASPRILDGSRPETIWFDGGTQNMFGDPIHKGMASKISRETKTRHHVFASGCAMLVRASLFPDVGKFDERFFAYSEDVDFCFRARKHAWRILHVPTAIAVHYPSSSVKRNKGKWFRDYYVTRNKLLLMHREVKGLRWVVFGAYFSVKHVLAPWLFFLASGQFKRVGAVWLGVSDFVAGRTGMRYS